MEEIKKMVAQEFGKFYEKLSIIEDRIQRLEQQLTLHNNMMFEKTKEIMSDLNDLKNRIN